ncbi:MAG: exodeoxyribonuclease VII large subunit [Oscillospiraceae bacterium]|jgi:exodeoxyribonuclease VII large subunit|nr:exodeoxyribonuclease VII large subunit [Oscillospiraceae bacterium]
MSGPLSVSQLNMYVKMLFENDEVLQNICVSGEISNLKQNFRSGHVYFSLKDEKCSITSVMFSHYASSNNFVFQDGVKVLIYGSVSSYVVSGKYQLYACKVLPLSKGEINEALQNLKSKLESEGLFEESRKRSLPRFPRKIGVITSKTGAVIHDIINVLKRRYPLAEIVLAPVRVQGLQAPEELIKAIDLLNSNETVDTIIIGRGGGSLEELWAFNEESVARKVAYSKVPIISAVGHDVNYTLCDFAADMRAPTPSSAAELASVSISEVFNLIKMMHQKCDNALKMKIVELRSKVEKLKINLTSVSPALKFWEIKSELKRKDERLKTAFKNFILFKKSNLELMKSRLSVLNPSTVIARGYAVIVDSNGKTFKRIKDLEKIESLKIIMQDGEAEFKLLISMCQV